MVVRPQQEASRPGKGSGQRERTLDASKGSNGNKDYFVLEFPEKWDQLKVSQQSGDPV